MEFPSPEKRAHALYIIMLDTPTTAIAVVPNFPTITRFMVPVTVMEANEASEGRAKRMISFHFVNMLIFSPLRIGVSPESHFHYEDYNFFKD
jgi:hypothetical protein